MQCVDVIPGQGLLTLANAGHPYPVLYSASCCSCDRLPVRGALLHAKEPDDSGARQHRLRHADLSDGDVIVLVSDGMMDCAVDDDADGYRFMEVITANAQHTAKRICASIVSHWHRRRHGAAPSDDVTVIVIKVGANREGSLQ
jgi:serine phosphatase RsbU (regulator of sigma subunit)